MRLRRNLAFVILAFLFVRAQQVPLSAGYKTCTVAWSGCVAAAAQCSPSLVDCNNLCQQGCPQYTGTYTAQGLACDGTANNGCPNPGPNPGQNMFLQASCACQVPCFDTWSGCGSNSECCDNNCNTDTWKCGVDCGMACGGDAACTCECEGGRWEFGECTPSPILINLANNGNDHLTSAADGVFFDIFANGTPVRVAWTSADSQVGFLVWDRDRNGTIDDGTELFGSVTRLRNGHMAANGFEALREWDSNNDRKIDSADPVYYELRLWFDANHNGYSEMNELFTLESVGVLSIETDYRETGRQDQWGNSYRYEGTAILRLNRDRVLRRIFDVFFKTLQ
jgi:hypothetical protein